MEQPPFSLRDLWMGLAALAGGITALSFREWRQMRTREILMTVFVGVSFAIFVAPWVAFRVFGIDDGDTQALAAIVYVMASGSNILVPVLIDWVRRSFGANGNRNKQEPTP